MKKVLSAGIVFPGFLLYGQPALHHTSAAGPGLAAFSNERADVFSFQNNPASLARSKHAAVGIMHERPFLLEALSKYHLTAALPVHDGSFGLNAAYAGFPLYHETELGVAYARSLGDKADAGIQFNDHNLQIPGYGVMSSMLFETGLLFHLTPQCNAGLHLFNPVHRKWKNIRKEKPPSIYSFGLGYDASKKLFIGVQIEKQEDQPVNIVAGMEYDFHPQIQFNMGIQSLVGEVYTGVGFLWRSSVIRLSTAFHPQLGITPSLSFLFSAVKEK